MYKLQLFKSDKTFAKSLSLENFGQITLKNKLGEMRELKIFVGLSLGIDYAKIVETDTNLIFLKLQENQMLFEKKTTSFSHLLAIGGSGQGTNEKTLILLGNNFYEDIYPTEIIDGKKYIKNLNYTGVENRFRIQQFENRFRIQQFENVTNEQDLYKKACSYIKNFENNSKQQIDRMNGESDITYISTAYSTLKFSKRNIAINTIYSGSLLKFLQLLSSDIDWILTNGDQFLSNYDTGAFDNFDMLEEVVKKIQGYNYRDLGFDGTKSIVEIADFSSLPVSTIIRNNQSVNNFYRQDFNFEELEFNYPSIGIKFTPSVFVKEGTPVLIDYKQVLYPKNSEKIIRQLKEKRVYQGADFTNISDYLSL